MSENPNRPRRVAVIGSGIAGLTAAYVLALAGERVTLIEKADALGMDAASGSVPGADGDVRVDVPLRVFFPSYYPNMSALYNHAGVATEPQNYDCSWSEWDEPGRFGKVIFCYRNLFLTAGTAISCPSVAHLFHSAGLRYLLDVAWLLYVAIPRDAKAALERAKAVASADPDTPIPPYESFRDYLLRVGCSTVFVDNVFIPATAGMLTCTNESTGAAPADILIIYLARMGLTRVHRVRGGVCDAVRRLAAPVFDVKLGTTVSALYPDDSKVVVETACGTREHYDKVIIAAQANHAVRILEGSSATPEAEAPSGGELLRSWGDESAEQESRLHPSLKPLRDALVLIPHEQFDLCVHSDTSLLPSTTAHWRSVNFCQASRLAPTASIWINRAQSSLKSPIPLIETWNPPKGCPDKAKTYIYRTFQRPLIGPETDRAIRSLQAVQGVAGVYVCGSYASYGMPLLENGVNSALKVCREMGVEIPFPASFDEPPITMDFRLRTLQGIVLASAVAVFSKIAYTW